MGRTELWLGRAWTGKSTSVARDIADRVATDPLGPKLYWVVPETVSFAAERLLMQHVPSTLRAEVVTLQRLALRIRQGAGESERQPVNQTGRRLLLAHVLRDCESDLQVLHKARLTMSLLDSILASFDELTDHLVPPDLLAAGLESAAAHVDRMTGPAAALAGRRLLGKLRDLCTLYVQYQRALAERGLQEPSQVMLQLAAVDGWHSMLAGARVYLDGFRRLTPRELQFAAALAASADHTALVLTADPDWFQMPWLHRSAGRPLGERRDGGLPFAPTEPMPGGMPSLVELVDATERAGEVFAPEAVRTVAEWLAVCATTGLPVTVRRFPEAGFPAVRKPALVNLEQAVFGNLAQSAPLASADDASDGRGAGESEPAVTLAAAQNIRAELDAVARDILQRVAEGACRFRDIAVVLPDPAQYSGILEERFAAAEVPVDVADAPALATYPLARFLLGALLAVDENLSTDSVVRLLKSDFCGISTADADWLEAYLVEHGIEGAAAWSKPWTFAADRAPQPDDPRARSADARAERLRAAMAPMLLRLVEQLNHPVVTPSEVADALWAAMEAVQARQTVAVWLVEEGSGDGAFEGAVHEQAWQRLLEVLNDLQATLPDGKLPRNFVFQNLRTHIATQRLERVPTKLNAVQVVDVERATAVHVKVAYVLGVTDGSLPRRIHSAGLLQDDEREQFAALFDRRIGETVQERQLGERWRVYTALTRASDALVVSFPMADLDGKERQPAALVRQIETADGGSVARETWLESGVLRAADAVWTSATALTWLMAAVRDFAAGAPLRPGSRQVFEWLLGQPVLPRGLAFALSGLTHRAAASPLPADLAGEVYGRPLHMNVYQLETVASCPFRHFLQYGLRLREPERNDVTAAERGTLIHAAVAGFVERFRSDLAGWRKLSDEAAAAAMDETVSRILGQPTFGAWTRSALRRAQAEEARWISRLAAVVLTRHVRHGAFVPERLELSFGTGPDAELPAFPVPLSDGAEVWLRGRMDRVDLAASAALEDAPVVLFRIIDYKSRSQALDLSRVYHGLQLQLAVYAVVLKHLGPGLFGRPVIPAGFFYQPLVRTLAAVDAPMDDRTGIGEAVARMKVRGLWKADREMVAAMDIRLVADGASELFPKLLKKDGTPVKGGPTLTSTEWEAMERAVIRRVRSLAETVARGEISVAPHALGRSDRACTTCPYQAVCQVDLRWDARPVRRLPKMTREQVAARWQEEESE
ncbi:MAG: PD-(D/E)XK nuclease family protein [Alicyclobacillus sp.]|nr:PD-(D/E)XK nuclease family protein [Alicyclobacillus sp.]